MLIYPPVNQQRMDYIPERTFAYKPRLYPLSLFNSLDNALPFVVDTIFSTRRVATMAQDFGCQAIDAKDRPALALDPDHGGGDSKY